MTQQYKHSTIADGHTDTNLTRYYRALAAVLGNDYMSWSKHPAYESVERMAHYSIYGRTDDYYNDGGLLLQVRFLQQAPNHLSNPNGGRQSTYKIAVRSAVEAGVVSIDTALDWALGRD